MLASSLSRRLRWSRIVFLYGVQSFSSEFGERTRITLVQQVRSSEKEGVNPGLAGSEFGERPVPFSELWQVRSWEKGQGRTLVRQLRSSEKGLGRAVVRQVRSSEKDQFLSPNSEEKKKNEKKYEKKNK